MSELPAYISTEDLRFGRSPALDAWLLHFLTENNIESIVSPRENASPEQVRFMVAMDEDQVYAPCSDRMLGLLLNKRLEDELRREYDEKRAALRQLVSEHVAEAATRERILALCGHKLALAEAQPIIIPSRLMKRLITIFLAMSGHKIGRAHV